MLRSALKLAAVVALGTAAVPQLATAQSFYDEDGPRPFVLHQQDDIAIDGDHARIARRQDFGPGYRDDARTYGPRVVYDERDPYRGREDWRERRFDGYRGYGRQAYRSEGPVYGYGPDTRAYGRPSYRSGYAPAAYGIDPTPIGPVPVGSAYGTIPEVGCTIEQSQGITPAGWRKIVTHRTCYRR